MKRTVWLSILLIVSMMVVCTTVNAESAEEVKDSHTVSEYDREQLKAAGEDYVIRIFNVGWHFGFSNTENIQDVISGTSVGEYFIVEKPDGTISCYSAKSAAQDYAELLKPQSYIDGKWVERPAISVPEKVWQAFKTREVVDQIAPDAEVNHIYYLYSANSRRGTAIFYETNYGDFVYLYQSGSEYLFPVMVFCEYMDKFEAKMSENAGLDGSSSVAGVADLSAFDLHSGKLDLSRQTLERSAWEIALPWVGAAAAVLVCGGAVAAVLWKKKRPSAEEEGA